MKAVIDVGSNSVRLLLQSNKAEKFIKITKLAEGLNLTGKLSDVAIKRTVSAVAFFKEKAIENNAEKIYIFATAAVRSASNGYEFVDAVKSYCDLDVDVISGEKEAEVGLIGVLKNSDGGIIDIGGASSEITTRINGETVYSHSLNLGGVRILDACGQDLDKISSVCKKAVVEYGKVPISTYYGIGGTATSIASVVLKLVKYDRNAVHGYVLKLSDVEKAIELFNSKTVEERKQIVGLQPERADVILGATVLLREIMLHVGINDIIVSEDDNLDGYLVLKGGLNE